MENNIPLTSDQRAARQADEMKTLQEKQIAIKSDELNEEYITGNRDSKSKIKKSEAGYVHTAVITRTLAPDSQSFIEDARVIKTHPNQFAQQIKNNAFGMYNEAKVIHDPRPNAPREYELKPQVAVSRPVDPGAVDAALAAREQKVREMEKSLDKKMADYQAQLKQGAKAETKVQPKPAVSLGASDASKASPANTESLPPLP